MNYNSGFVSIVEVMSNHSQMSLNLGSLDWPLSVPGSGRLVKQMMSRAWLSIEDFKLGSLLVKIWK